MKRHEEAREVLEAIRRLIKASPHSQRWVEETAGFSRGYLSQLLAANLDLKYWHVIAILSSLDVDPGEFFAGIYPSRKLPSLEGFRASSEPVPESVDRLLGGLYELGIDSLAELRRRLDHCESAIRQLRASGVPGRGGHEGPGG